jgi:hypothetical protein
MDNKEESFNLSVELVVREYRSPRFSQLQKIDRISMELMTEQRNY